MAVTLFRPEAREHQRAAAWGEMTLPVPVSITTTTIFLAACVATLASFLAYGTYTRKEHVIGFLVPQLGIARVVPPRGGTIIAMRVGEGELVRQGAPLLTIGADQANDHGQAIDGNMLDSLNQQIDRLHAEIGLEQHAAVARRNALEAEMESLEHLTAALQAEHVVQVQRAQIADRDLIAIGGLVQDGEMSQVEQRRRQDAALAQLQAESGTARAIIEKQEDLRRARSQVAELPLTLANRVTPLINAAAELSARIADIDGHRAYQLTAPVSGRISALQAWIGKSVDTVTPTMSIVPQGDMLHAELLVPARAIGFVKPGQRVRLNYDTFPTQQFGFADGRVQAVSRTMLKPAEFSGPIVPDTPFYRVTVTLARQMVHAEGGDIPLQTDTVLQADIMLDNRPLLSWLVSPIEHAWGRS